jgi:hypothetical protein
MAHVPIRPEGDPRWPDSTVIVDAILLLVALVRCIASNWVECWEQHIVSGFGPEWALENRHGW